MTKSGPASRQVRQGDAPDAQPAQPGRTASSIREPGSPGQPWADGLTSATPVVGPSGALVADVPNRVIACAIDLVLLAVIGFVVSLPVSWLLGTLVAGPGELNLAAFLVTAILHLAAGYLYFVRTWIGLRASPGLYLLGMRLGHERDGSHIGSAQGSLRWVLLGIPATLVTFPVYVASVVAWLFFAVGAVWLVVLLLTMSVSPTRQGLHDRYAHTIVLKAPRRSV